MKQPVAPQSSLTAEQTEFFETKIRPVLVKHCYQCHSEEAKSKNQLKGGLLLDTQAGTLQGGDSGTAVVPKKPADSLLLEALRYGEFKMPPKGKLPDSVIADFETWISMGAPDPRISQVDPAISHKKTGIDLEAGRTFWAYLPVRASTHPVVKRADWPQGAIDQFILSALEAKGVQPVDDASKIVLVRRLYFDLIGIAPTPEQIDAFVADTSPTAYEQLVDDLLATSHFGERWGRHWLDVARYAESLTLRGFIFPEAWRYRDYVIESFNQDRPYDQFIREQISGDLIQVDPGRDSLEEKQRRLVATTFLMLGNTNLEEQDKVQLRMDVVDEQLDVIGKGILAQTVTCARCHDHKFDPIPTRDYYALAGILRNSKSLEHANVSKWLELPLPVAPHLEKTFQEHEAAVANLEFRIGKIKSELKSLTGTAAPAKGAEIVPPKSLPGVVVDDTQARKVGEWKFSQFSKRYIGEGYLHDLDQNKGSKTLTFQPELPKAGIYEVRLAYSYGESRSTEVPVTIFAADGEKTIKVNQQIVPPVDGRFVSLGQFRFEQNGQGFVIVSNEDTKGHVTADAVQFLPLDMVDTKVASSGKTGDDKDVPPDSKVNAQRQKELKNELSGLEKQLKELTASGPKRPLYMSVQEEKTIEDCAVHIRGTVHNLGEKVPRGFLQVASWQASPVVPAAGQSGRLELGAWLADRRNPLTARVMTNRVWHWLFGSGLVRTVDNFGTTGEKPSHPELLDHLAAEFMNQNWSVKRLVRQVVLSRTYRLASLASPELIKEDPENRLFGHANRRRLDAECILDSILLTSGKLETPAGGPTIRPGTASDFGYESHLNRRAVYWPVLRNSLPEIFEVFDYPDPSMVGGRRNVSTVAPQALFLMNNSFVVQQSQSAAERVIQESGLTDEQRIDLIFRRIIGRLPSTQERAKATEFIQARIDDTDKSKVQRWGRLIQAVFGTMDFRYVD